ncbi:MAG: FtsH protease activity modulator HflK [Candidatus Rokubacteria bacterium]|nr:FtsH protease activity modulator HflK [Candidatus Rokubacteria bacterium]
MNTWPPQRPPDLQAQLEPLRRIAERLGPRRLVVGALVAVVLLWLVSGFYVVGPGERGVVLLFGRVVEQTESGLRYRLPAPIQQHHIVDIATVRRAEIGFRAARGSTRSVPTEALMLTGDENIVDVQLFVQYLVQDPVQFLFRARHPETALQSSAEVALRAAVGENSIDYTMTEGRVEVQDRVKKQLQDLLDLYATGLQATEVRLLVVDPPKEVKEAFHDVVRAWEDRERLIKEAEGYAEGVVPKARGEAVQMLRAAEAYREQRLIRARGDADRFVRILAEYKKAEAVTRDRLYLEMVDRVLPKTRTVVVESGANGSVVPLLPLGDFFPDRKPAKTSTAEPEQRPAAATGGR